MGNTLLLLSTAAHAPAAVDVALKKAKESKGILVVLFVSDAEMPKTVFDRLEGTGFVSEKSGNNVYRALVDEYKRQGEQQLEHVKHLATKQGIETKTLFCVGDIADECIKVIRAQNIDVAVVTRWRKSQLSRFIFGSPIKKIQDNVSCHFEIVDQD